MTTHSDPQTPLTTPIGSVTGTAGLDGPPRLTQHALLGTSSLLLVMAVLLPFYAYPRIAELPADPQRGQLQVDPHGTVLVPDAHAAAWATVLHDTPVTLNTYAAAAPGGGTHGDSVVWQLATQLTVDGHGLLDARVETVSLDRHTAEPTNCCGDRLATDANDPVGKPLVHRGLVAWPFDVQKRSYQVWDVLLNRSRTAWYVGEERRDGVRTYKFQAVTPAEKVGTRELPGALFGLRDPSVVADSVYTDTRTYWIEPATGSVVDLHEDLLQEYRYRGRVLTALSASLDSPPLTDAQLRQTKAGALVLPWLRGRASVVMCVIGVVLFLFALRRHRRHRRPLGRHGGVPVRPKAINSDYADGRRGAPSR